MEADERGAEPPADEYAGPAVVVAAEAEVAVEVTLRGQFEPLDGRFHWYGRVAANARLDEHARSGSTVTVRTPHGSAEGRLSDVDPWGRFRVSGTGRPPF
jgi:hypothetical protein